MTLELATLVTGAASGIGLATVETLLAGGHKVVAADRDGDALAMLRARGEPHLHCELLDVTDELEVAAVIDRGIAALGPIGGVVNFILRKDYQGIEFAADYGVADADDGSAKG